jgi:threonine dehydrogenase-like Zn-dependent dehydrogenase
MPYMKAVIAIGEGQVKIADDIPIPILGDYEALCKVHACGFCNGTDLQIIDGTLVNGFGGFPTVLGHEGAGEIVALGKKVRHIHIGDRYIHPNLHPNVGNGYSKTHGSMAQYGIINDDRSMLEDGFNAENLPFPRQHKFPSSIDYIDAGVLLSLAECHSAVVNFGVKPEMDILIYGAGPMGIALAMFCGFAGAHVTQIDGVSERLAYAKKVAKVEHTINFDEESVDSILNGICFDMVIDAVGLTTIIYEASNRLKPGGKVGSLGVLKKDDRLINTALLKNNTSIHMLNFPYGEYAIMDKTIRLITDGTIQPKDFYSHIMPYTEIDKAIGLVRGKKVLKIILTFDD